MHAHTHTHTLTHIRTHHVFILLWLLCEVRILENCLLGKE